MKYAVNNGFRYGFRNFTVAVLHALLLTACASNAHDGMARPTWIENPGDGVSASAGINLRGKEAQEALAIDRAKAEIIKRYGLFLEPTAIEQSDCKATIKAKWLDPVADTLWVWLVPTSDCTAPKKSYEESLSECWSRAKPGETC